MPTTEIVSFVLAEDADLSVALTIPARQPGCLGYTAGRKAGEGERETFCWLILWQSLDDHERFMQHPNEYPTLHKELAGKMLGDPHILHIDFENSAALRAPVLDVHIVENTGDIDLSDSSIAWGRLHEDSSLFVVVRGQSDSSVAPSVFKHEVQRYRVPVQASSWYEACT